MKTLTSTAKDDFLEDMRPSFRSYYQDKIDYVQRIIQHVFPENECEMQWFDQSLNDSGFVFNRELATNALYLPMRQYLKAKGKLFRPILCSLLLEAYGKDPDHFKSMLVIPEMIHCSSLVLDDIVDHSILRRGEKCSHLIHGVSLAGNGSMAATFYAFSLINDKSAPLSDSDRLRLYEMLYWEHYGCSIGTALDLGWSKLKLTEIDRDQYIQHIVYRSCAYTYRVAARLGAIAGGASEKEQEILFNYGTLTGIAFQFIDDILNLKPDTPSWGKTVGEDITEGKRSPLVLHTLKAASAKDKKNLLKILDSKSQDPSIIQQAIAIMDSYGAFEETRAEAYQYINLACEEADKLSISERYRTLLKDFAIYIVERKV